MKLETNFHQQSRRRWRNIKRTRFKWLSIKRENARHISSMETRLVPPNRCFQSFLFTLPFVSIIIIIVCLFSIVSCQSQQPAAEGSQLATGDGDHDASNRWPSVYLPRLGLVRGLRFDGLTNKGPSVAAFLGLPYAGAPTGQLRFMPPPGQTSGQSSWHGQSREQCRLAGQQATVATRSFVRFGPECVRLSDWYDSSNRTLASKVNSSQAEDCLNLNVFVPLLPVIRRIGSGGTSSKRAKREAVKSEDDELANYHYERLQQYKINSSHLMQATSDVRQSRRDGNSSKTRDNDHHQQHLPAEEEDKKEAEAIERADSRSAGIRVPRSEANSISQEQELADNHSVACHLTPLASLLGNSDSDREMRPLPVLVVFHSDEKSRVRDDLDKMDPIRDNEDDRNNNSKQQRQQQQAEKKKLIKANSFAYVELAQLTGSIVITFNNRIGLMGFLPFVDFATDTSNGGKDNPTSASTGLSGSFETGGSSSGAQITRQNHAIWDQIGLLHWLKKNVANFGGDPANISLISGDNRAAVQLELLATSPLVKGLFKRLVLVHDAGEEERSASGNSEGVSSKPEVASIGNLLELATKTREMRRKLSDELNLIVRKLIQQQVDPNGRSPKLMADIDDGDERKVFEFIQAASLAELAQIELELERLNDARLSAFVSQPNLNDKLLFPHFAALLRAFKINQQRNGSARGDGPVAVSNQNRNKLANWLEVFAGGHQKANNFFNLATRNMTRHLERVRDQADFCHYMRKLWTGINEMQLYSAADNLKLAELLQRIDPLGLLPRPIGARDHQQQFSSMNETHQRSTSSITSKWRPNDLNKSARQLRLSNEFKHLKYGHLLNELLSFKANNGRGLRSSEANTNGYSEEEDEEELLASKRQQQKSLRILQSAGDGSILGRVQRGVASTFASSSDDFERLLESLAAFELVVGYIGSSSAFKTNGAEDGIQQGGESMANVINFKNVIKILSEQQTISYNDTIIKDRLLQLVQLADLHSLASLLVVNNVEVKRKNSDNYCDFSSSSEITIRQEQPKDRNQPFVSDNNTIKTTKTTSSTNFRLIRRTDINTGNTLGSWLFERIDDDKNLLANFLNTSSDHNLKYHSFDRKFNIIGNEDQNELDSETTLQKRLQFKLDLVPYLSRLDNDTTDNASFGSDSGKTMGSPPYDWLICLNELNDMIGQYSSRNRNELPSRTTNWISQHLQDESHCLINPINRMRLHLRAELIHELEHLLDKKQIFYNLNQTLHQRISTMTTRNLVNQSEGIIFLDDHLEAANQQGQSYIGLNDESQQATKEAVLGSRQATISISNSSSNGNSSFISGLFAKTYKDAVGQALAVVIGTGLMIFLLNLIIVLVIALRSARARRRQSNTEASCDLNESDGREDAYGAQLAQTALVGGHISMMAQSDACDQKNISEELKHRVEEMMPTFGQKSTLKKQSSNCIFGDQEHQQTFGQSNHSIRASKSIKFDLTGIENESKHPQTITISDADQVYQDEDHFVGGNITLPMYTNNQTDMLNSVESSELFLSPDPEMMMLAQQQDADRLYEEQQQQQSCIRIDVDPNQSCMLNRHSTIDYQQETVAATLGGSLTSPFESQSTTNGSISNQRSAAQNQQNLSGSSIMLNHLQCHNHPHLHHHHHHHHLTANSPSPSTTLSTETPIQEVNNYTNSQNTSCLTVNLHKTADRLQHSDTTFGNQYQLIPATSTSTFLGGSSKQQTNHSLRTRSKVKQNRRQQQQHSLVELVPIDLLQQTGPIYYLQTSDQQEQQSDLGSGER